MLCQDSKSIADILEKSKLSGFKRMSKKNTGPVKEDDHGFRTCIANSLWVKQQLKMGLCLNDKEKWSCTISQG